MYDEKLCKATGDMFKKTRIVLDLTITNVSNGTAISIPTLKKFENGEPIQRANLVQRAYEMYLELHVLVNKPQITKLLKPTDECHIRKAFLKKLVIHNRGLKIIINSLMAAQDNMDVDCFEIDSLTVTALTLQRITNLTVMLYDSESSQEVFDFLKNLKRPYEV